MKIKMKHKYITLTIVLLTGFGLSEAKAQEAPNASGGNGSGSGGSASYSMGQIVYTTNKGTNGSVAQGIQQPFEISVITAINEAAGINIIQNFVFLWIIPDEYQNFLPKYPPKN